MYYITTEVRGRTYWVAKNGESWYLNGLWDNRHKFRSKQDANFNLASVKRIMRKKILIIVNDGAGIQGLHSETHDSGGSPDQIIRGAVGAIREIEV